MTWLICSYSKIRELAEKFSEDVQEVWRRKPAGMVSEPNWQTAPLLPAIKSEHGNWFQQAGRASDMDAGARGNQRNPVASQSTEDTASPGGNASSSEDSGEDEDEQFSKIDMDALKQRGKGSYYCPLGLRCDKGGVDKDGKLVLFDRNSSFA